MPKKKFPGFAPSLVHFLSELENHNNREWFAKNKARYESDVLAPSLEFIAAMAEPLAKISPHFRAVAKRTGGSLLRIYRDTRFAKDKTPYKTNVGIHFRHEKCGDVHAPGFYFHIEPGEVFLGVGSWHPESATLKAIRKRIDARPDEWKRVRDNRAFRSRFDLSGDSLKRPPRDFEADHPCIVDLKRKDFIAVQQWEHDRIFSPSVVRDTTAAFQSSAPFMKFLCDAIGAKF
jgi:uncharacterized protein (TIGR02453 family)